MDRNVPVRYEPGRPWGICDRCGMKYRLDELQVEWSGLKVCPADFDPKPDTLNPPRIIPEGLAARDARPELPDTFIAQEVTPDQL